MKMEFKIDKQILQNGLTQLSPFLEKKDLKNPCASYYFSIDNCVLTLFATDYNMSLKLELTSIYDAIDGSFLVDGNSMLNTVKRLKNGEVHLLVNGDELTIKQGKSKLKLQTVDVKTYPNINIDETKMKSIDIKNDVLLNGIKRTIFAVDSNNPKYELNAMLFDFRKTLRLVGTNTRSLAAFDTGIEFDKEMQILVPKTALVEMQKIILDNCQFLYDDTHLRIKTTDLIFTTKLINGKFPDYSRVMPSNWTYDFKIPRDLLIDNIKMITALDDLVRLNFDENLILLESGEGKLTSSTEMELVQECNEKITIKVSSTQFLNALNSIENELFTFNANAHNLPFSVKSGKLTIINMPYIELNRGE